MTYQNDKRRYEIARAAAQDAATRQMMAQGRTRWNEDDYGLACATVTRILGEPDE